jgi:hypothetical protein
MTATTTAANSTHRPAWIAPALAATILLAVPFVTGCAASSARSWAETAPTVRQGEDAGETVNLSAWPER